ATPGAVWPGAQQAGRNLSRVGTAEGVPDHRRTPDAGPRAHVYCNSPEISGRLGDRIFEREERHSDGPLVWQRAEFYGRAFLGPWIRRVHRGLRVGAGPPVHPRAGICGWEQRRLLISFTEARFSATG